MIKERNNAQVGEIESQLQKYSWITLEKGLGYMDKEGLLLKTGEGRGVRNHVME